MARYIFYTANSKDIKDFIGLIPKNYTFFLNLSGVEVFEDIRTLPESIGEIIIHEPANDPAIFDERFSTSEYFEIELDNKNYQTQLGSSLDDEETLLDKWESYIDTLPLDAYSLRDIVGREYAGYHFRRGRESIYTYGGRGGYSDDRVFDDFPENIEFVAAEARIYYFVSIFRSDWYVNESFSDREVSPASPRSDGFGPRYWCFSDTVFESNSHLESRYFNYFPKVNQPSLVFVARRSQNYDKHMLSNPASYKAQYTYDNSSSAIVSNFQWPDTKLGSSFTTNPDPFTVNTDVNIIPISFVFPTRNHPHPENMWEVDLRPYEGIWSHRKHQLKIADAGDGVDANVAEYYRVEDVSTTPSTDDYPLFRYVPLDVIMGWKDRYTLVISGNIDNTDRINHDRKSGSIGSLQDRVWLDTSEPQEWPLVKNITEATNTNVYTVKKNQAVSVTMGMSIYNKFVNALEDLDAGFVGIGGAPAHPHTVGHQAVGSGSVLCGIRGDIDTYNVRHNLGKLTTPVTDWWTTSATLFNSRTLGYGVGTEGTYIVDSVGDRPDSIGVADLVRDISHDAAIKHIERNTLFNMTFEPEPPPANTNPHSATSPYSSFVEYTEELRSPFRSFPISSTSRTGLVPSVIPDVGLYAYKRDAYSSWWVGIDDGITLTQSQRGKFTLRANHGTRPTDFEHLCPTFDPFNSEPPSSEYPYTPYTRALDLANDKMFRGHPKGTEVPEILYTLESTMSTAYDTGYRTAPYMMPTSQTEANKDVTRQDPNSVYHLGNESVLSSDTRNKGAGLGLGFGFSGAGMFSQPDTWRQALGIDSTTIFAEPIVWGYHFGDIKQHTLLSEFITPTRYATGASSHDASWILGENAGKYVHTHHRISVGETLLDARGPTAGMTGATGWLTQEFYTNHTDTNTKLPVFYVYKIESGRYWRVISLYHAGEIWEPDAGDPDQPAASFYYGMRAREAFLDDSYYASISEYIDNNTSYSLSTKSRVPIVSTSRLPVATQYPDVDIPENHVTFMAHETAKPWNILSESDFPAGSFSMSYNDIITAFGPFSSMLSDVIGSGPYTYTDVYNRNRTLTASSAWYAIDQEYTIDIRETREHLYDIMRSAVVTGTKTGNELYDVGVFNGVTHQGNVYRPYKLGRIFIGTDDATRYPDAVQFKAEIEYIPSVGQTNLHRFTPFDEVNEVTVTELAMTASFDKQVRLHYETTSDEDRELFLFVEVWGKDHAILDDEKSEWEEAFHVGVNKDTKDVMIGHKQGTYGLEYGNCRPGEVPIRVTRGSPDNYKWHNIHFKVPTQSGELFNRKRVYKIPVPDRPDYDIARDGIQPTGLVDLGPPPLEVAALEVANRDATQLESSTQGILPPGTTHLASILPERLSQIGLDRIGVEYQVGIHDIPCMLAESSTAGIYVNRQDRQLEPQKLQGGGSDFLTEIESYGLINQFSFNAGSGYDYYDGSIGNDQGAALLYGLYPAADGLEIIPPPVPALSHQGYVYQGGSISHNSNIITGIHDIASHLAQLEDGIGLITRDETTRELSVYKFRYEKGKTTPYSYLSGNSFDDTYITAYPLLASDMPSDTNSFVSTLRDRVKNYGDLFPNHLYRDVVIKDNNIFYLHGMNPITEEITPFTNRQAMAGLVGVFDYPDTNTQKFLYNVYQSQMVDLGNEQGFLIAGCDSQTIADSTTSDSKYLEPTARTLWVMSDSDLKTAMKTKNQYAQVSDLSSYELWKLPALPYEGKGDYDSDQPASWLYAPDAEDGLHFRSPDVLLGAVFPNGVYWTVHNDHEAKGRDYSMYWRFGTEDDGSLTYQPRRVFEFPTGERVVSVSEAAGEVWFKVLVEKQVIPDTSYPDRTGRVLKGGVKIYRGTPNNDGDIVVTLVSLMPAFFDATAVEDDLFLDMQQPFIEYNGWVVSNVPCVDTRLGLADNLKETVSFCGMDLLGIDPATGGWFILPRLAKADSDVHGELRIRSLQEANGVLYVMASNIDHVSGDEPFVYVYGVNEVSQGEDVSAEIRMGRLTANSFLEKQWQDIQLQLHEDVRDLTVTCQVIDSKYEHGWRYSWRKTFDNNALSDAESSVSFPREADSIAIPLKNSFNETIGVDYIPLEPDFRIPEVLSSTLDLRWVFKLKSDDTYQYGNAAYPIKILGFKIRYSVQTPELIEQHVSLPVDCRDVIDTLTRNGVGEIGSGMERLRKLQSLVSRTIDFRDLDFARTGIVNRAKVESVSSQSVAIDTRSGSQEIGTIALVTLRLLSDKFG